MPEIKCTPRPATEDDLETVVRMETKAFPTKAWSKNAFAAELSKKFSHFWVLTDDETDTEIFAYVVFAFPAEQAHIQTIAVRQENRRQGYAQQLIRAIIAYVSRKKGESIALEVRESNIAAIALYQSLGFIIVHKMKKFYPDGEDAFNMVYNLNSQKIKNEELDESFSESDRSPKNFN